MVLLFGSTRAVYAHDLERGGGNIRGVGNVRVGCTRQRCPPHLADDDLSGRTVSSRACSSNMVIL
jgi:hypothetical protein